MTMTYWMSSHAAHPHTCTGPSPPPCFLPPLHVCLEPASTGTCTPEHLAPTNSTQLLSLTQTIINCSLISKCTFGSFLVIASFPVRGLGTRLLYGVCVHVSMFLPLPLQGVYQHGHFSFSAGANILSPCAPDCRLS